MPSLVKNASNPNPSNILVNGGMDFWQRNISFLLVNSTQYTADRWNCFVNAGTSTGSTLARDTDVPSSSVSPFSMKITRILNDTNVGGFVLVQPVELRNSRGLQNKTLTLSFWAKKGANYSPASSFLQVLFHTGTGNTDPAPAGSLTGQVSTAVDITLTSSWQRFSLSFSVPSDATQIRPQVRANHTGTAGADDSFFITGIMLTEGPAAPTSFYRAGSTIEDEFTMCQRYYEKSFDLGTVVPTADSAGAVSFVPQSGVNNGNAISGVQFKTFKRTNPTVTIYNTTSAASGSLRFNSANHAVTAAAIGQSGFQVVNNTGVAFPAAGAGSCATMHYVAEAEL